MEFLSKVFLDGAGHFQWASVAALTAFLVGVITAWASIYNTKKSLKANVVSNARIEWIQEVRKRSVDFISACYSLVEYHKKNHTDDNKEELDKIKNEIEKSGTLLILYFGPDKNKNNELIVAIIDNLIVHMTNRDGYYNEKNPSLVNQVYVLKDFLRIYFKAEWKRANGGIKDTEIQIYLEGHEIYNRIMNIFEDMIDMHYEWSESFYWQLQQYYKHKED